MGGGEGDKNVPKPPQNRTLCTIVIAPPLFRTLEHPLDFVSQRPSYRGLCGGCRRPQLPFRGLAMRLLEVEAGPTSVNLKFSLT